MAKTYKFLVATMGPGETSQGVAFARYALQHGAKVVFAVQREENLNFLGSAKERKSFTRVAMTETPAKLVSLIVKEKPDALILCNSKMFHEDPAFRDDPPPFKPKTFSIDSNWLFSLDPRAKYNYARWVDNYLINLPPAVFKAGLKKYGGAYEIHPSIMEKIRVVGLIPSYQKPTTTEIKKTRSKYGVLAGEKLIFSYGGFGVTNKPEAIRDIFPAVKTLVAKGKKIKLIYVGEKANVEKQYERAPWLVHLEELGSNEFYLALASSDLIYQHQGLGTMAQAISANIPIIANVRNLPTGKFEHTHAWEVGPFQRVGACIMFYFGDSTASKQRAVEKLLFDKSAATKMKTSQRKIYQEGEAAALRIVLGAIKSKK